MGEIVLFLRGEKHNFTHGHYIIHFMDSATAQRLLELNRQFYQTFGEAFSATRGRIQPGVRSLFPTLLGMERILDLGCGNGELGRELARAGFRGEYNGLDFSLPLLRDAESQPGLSASFHQADLTRPHEWPTLHPPYPIITCFATLHHIPGRELRLQLLQKAHDLLPQGGTLILSNWQFLNSDRLKARIQPWEKAGLDATTIDEGDYLLDWRSGGEGLRYAHHFAEAELESLATASQFRVKRSFLSDGENSRLGLYQVWEKAKVHEANI